MPEAFITIYNDFIVPYVKVNLIGDKGYITNKKFKIFDREVKITTPKRKNQKVKNTNAERQLLRGRLKIENLFAKLKNNNRVAIRRDKNIKHYLSFVYIAFFEIYLDYVN